MGPRLTIACVSMVALLGAAGPALGQQNPYRLKATDEKKICLACHTDFDQSLKKRFVHTPVRSGDCSGCHDPHVSTHGKLLSRAAGDVCGSCHENIIPAKAKSAHKVVADGDCQKCHDPHASDNAANLKAKGNELCLGCHKAFGEALGKVKFRHTPVGQGCLTCHDAHGSEKSVGILKSSVPSLCLTCHNPNVPAFQARHMKYPVAKASCTACHDPHGSNQSALLLGNLHAPVKSGTCNQCHEAPQSANPFAVKQAGFRLCKGCHGEVVSAVFAKSRLHWPVADSVGCVNCHSPHASRYSKLLKADGPQLCGRCHADTLKRIGQVAVKHAPVEGGSCIACHAPHASDTPHLFEQASTSQVCAKCHDYQKHSAHPIGEKAIDQRNKNLRVECLSCHKGHGTPFKWMLLTETTAELCTGCHKKYRR